MLLAENRGRQLVLKHVNSWFVKKDVLFFDSLKKNNTKTLKTMYQTKVQGKQDEQKVIKADRKLLQRLLTASMAGRQIKMDEVLQHELSSLPLSLAKIHGDMNFTSKSDMTDIVYLKDIYMLFTGWEVRTGKIFCRGLKNGRGRRPRDVFETETKYFSVRTDLNGK